MYGFGPVASVAPYVFLACIVVTAIAAFTDWKSGIIPNWLTGTGILAGPIVHGLSHGWEGLLGCLLAVVFCGAVPVFMLFRGGMFGGDVKLFLAIASLAGWGVGIEAQLLAYTVAAVYALGRLAWDGALLRTLSNTVFIVVNPVLPHRLRRPIAPELLSTLRLGGPIFAGTTLAVVGRIQSLLG
jgi:prepilin peptidase CpaA